MPKAISISRSEILRRKKSGGGGPEVEKLLLVKVLESEAILRKTRTQNVLYVDVHCHRHCRRDPRITKF